MVEKATSFSMSGFLNLMGSRRFRATLYTLGEDEAAYKVLGHAHALNPEDRDTANLLFKETLILASKEETQKKYTSALAYLRTARQLQPQDQEVQRRISKLLRRVSHSPAQ